MLMRWPLRMGRIAELEEKLDKAMRKACEMRNAIDMIEGGDDGAR